MGEIIRYRLNDDDRRKFARVLKFISGCLLFEGKAMDCLVIDLSVNGARLLFDRPLPDFAEARVRLSLKLRLTSPIDLPIEVVWRDGMLLGVRFMSDPYEVAKALESLLPKECLEFVLRRVNAETSSGQ